MIDSLERLSRANPVPADLPAPPIEPVLRRLETEPPSSQAPPSRRAAGHAALAVGVAVAVAVAVLAVILVGRSRVAHTPATPTHLRTFGGLGRLRAEFGVLRRPQDAADRQLQTRAGTAIPAFTRLALTLPGGERVYLTVDSIVRHRTVDYALDTWVVNGRTSRVTQYIADTPLPAVPWRARLGREFTWISVVPNPVKLVRWTFRRAGSGRAFVVDVRVHGNVAAALVGSSVAPTAPVAAWYGAGGRRLGAFTVPVLARLQSSSAWPTRGTLTADGVLGVHFGTLSGPAIVELGARLRRAPTLPYTKGSDKCGLDHVAWGALTIYFWHRRFVSYQYGTFGSPRPLPALLTGPDRLAPGEAIAAAQKRFGRAFTTKTAQGGSWSLRTAAGELIGYASQPHGGRIVTIDAGMARCASLTP